MKKDLKEKLKFCIEYQYRIMENETLFTIMEQEEFDELESCYDVATKEELFNLLKVYHLELSKLRKEIKEIVEE